jgi:hypothetical protein
MRLSLRLGEDICCRPACQIAQIVTSIQRRVDLTTISLWGSDRERAEEMICRVKLYGFGEFFDAMSHSSIIWAL